MRIDLHLHSAASDGVLAPAALVEAAARAELDVIAITDHDTTAGWVEARDHRPPSLTLIPGIEMSSTHEDRELHILGYGIDPFAPDLAAHADAAVRRRIERMHGMIGRLVDLGLPIRFEDVLEEAGPTTAIGRPHLARALVQRGMVQSYGTAFERFLADGGPAFLPTELLTPRAAIDLIHRAGGLAVWAHPPEDAIDALLPELAGWGLDGIECFRPRTSPEERRRLADLARARGLVVTGGSDWHGAWHGTLGAFALAPDEVAEFLTRVGIPAADPEARGANPPAAPRP